MRYVKISFVVMLVLLIAGGGLAFLYLQSTRPVYHGEIRTTGVSEKTKVIFDNFGIPHIYAKSEHDAYFALGYVHAQERLFQMEILRRISSGRLAEIFGKELVKVDAFFRTLGIKESARESAKLFSTREKTRWKNDALSYLEGVNFFIKNGATPPEFLMLNIPKNDFTPEDIYLISGYMAFSFVEALKTDPIVSRIRDQFGADYLVPFGMEINNSNPKIPDSVVTSYADIPRFTEDVLNLLPIKAWLGSNSWLLSPSRSKNGQVLLANDTHIGYQQPAVWFEAHLEYPGFGLYGNYLAGLPFPLLGHSRNAAWGLTMLENDDMNLYLEKTDQKGNYYHDDKWKKIKVRKETIHVKGGNDTIIDIRETIHGPVINDVVESVGGYQRNPVSLWWTYTKFPSTALQVTYLLSHAENPEQARKAASMVHAPGLNIMYGDSKGNIAWWAAARLAEYNPDINTRLILDGTDSKNDVSSYFDFSLNPQSENPDSGYLCTANQPITVNQNLYPGYYAPVDRSERIKMLLRTKPTWSVEELKLLTSDVTSTSHFANAALILDVLENDSVLITSPIHEKAVTLLQNWKGQHRVQDKAPTIYYKLLSYIFEYALMDELGKMDYPVFVNTHLMKNSYYRLLANDSTSWWDNNSTVNIKETRKQIFKAAFAKTVEDLQFSSGAISNWTWGSVHTLQHIHPIGKKEPFDKIFNVGPFQVPGGIETINNAGFPLSTGNMYPVSYGPAMRLLVDFSSIENGWSILPTGQSGHVMSPHYRDQCVLYNSGKFRLMMMNKMDIEENSRSNLTFIPE